MMEAPINGLEKLNYHERLKISKHVQLRKETRALHDNLWLATTGGNQGLESSWRGRGRM